MINALLYLMITFAAIYILATILIISELQRRNIKINFFLIRLLLFKYVSQYKKITIEESGSPGLLYYLWIISVNLMALSALGMIIYKVV